MGAGPRTETCTGATSSVPLLKQTKFLNLPPCELGSVIFGCTHSTYDECVKQLVFGLPANHLCYVEKIRPGLNLFLFNYSDRKLHGIFVSDSCGGSCINPYAWAPKGSGKTSFPAQVRVRVETLCRPLPEKVFKKAIFSNYYSETHFYFELNHPQTKSLLTLFSNQKMESDTDWIKPKRVVNSCLDAWHNAAPFVPSCSLKLQSSEGEGKIAISEHWENISNVDVDTNTDMSEEHGNMNVNAQETVTKTQGHLSDSQQSKKSDKELEVLEKLKQLQKQKGKKGEVKGVIPSQSENSMEKEAISSSGSGSNHCDSSRLEWEKLARERCLQEQSMLRDEREQLRETLLSVDVPMAKAVSKNLELCASALAQMRQNQIELRQIKEDASNQAELLREIDELKKKNAVLEYTQVQMTSELDSLKQDLAKLSEQMTNLLQSTRPSNRNETTVKEEQTGPLHYVYLLGGYNGSSWLDTVDVWCPKNNDFTTVAPMLASRSYAAATVLKDQIYIFGGGNGAQWFDTAEVYDSYEDTWTACSSMSISRGNLGGATVGDRIFALGGGNGRVHFSNVECYDAHLGMWMESTSMLNERFGTAAAELDGVLYAIGGFGGLGGKKYLSSVERFDPREALWTAVAPMNSKRLSLSAVSLGGKLYAIGGYDGTQFLNSVEYYEPRTNTWTEMDSKIQVGRAYGTAANIDGKIYMFGGLSDGEQSVSLVERYTENAGWEVIDDIPIGCRCFLTSCVLEYIE